VLPGTSRPRIIDLIGCCGLAVEKVVSSTINMDDIVTKGFEELGKIANRNVY